MKKLISIILVLGLLAAMAGCGNAAAPADDIKQGTVILPSGSSSETPDDSAGEGEFPAATQDPPTATTEKPQQSTGSNTTPTDSVPEKKPDTPASDTTAKPPVTQQKPVEQPNQTPVSSDEYRAVWISYLELGGMLTGKTEQQFRDSIAAAFSNIAAKNMNTVVVHARPFGDALYASSVFPTSYLITGTEGAALPFDPLAIMVTEAHRQGLSIEAWVNPYRVRASAAKPLAAGNPAQQFLNSGSSAVYRYNNGIYYNPGSQEAIDLIVAGIKEIVQNYDVDGIHFDDYFYATTESSIDASLYAAYQFGGGGLSLADWRRSNVNTMVRQVYSAIKAIDSSVRFGISPQGNTSINYSTLYADVATWVGNTGYVDYICPQIYYGFNHATCAYNTVLNEFNSMIKVNSVDLYAGLAAYKIGTVDSYAGASGKNEWVNNTNMLSRMVTSARTASRCRGFTVYSYSSLFTPASAVKRQVDAELSALISIL